MSLEKGTNGDCADIGKAWFNLLSDRKDCLYLSKSPNGKPYELAPTIEGVSIALWSLLVAGDDKVLNRSTHPWQSMQDLVDFWSRHSPEHPLFIHQDTLRHIQSNDEIVEHETVVIGSNSNSRAIEIRLRCDWEEACGMAAVTRLAKQPAQYRLDPEQMHQLHRVFSAATNGDIRARHDPSLAMLCLAMPSCETSMQDLQSPASSVLAMLAAPYGPDRRAIWLDGVDNEELLNHRERQEFIQSKQKLKEQLLHACHLCQEFPTLGIQLLCWILQESPTVVERSKSLLVRDEGICSVIEQAILALPTGVLENESILEAIEWNWACRETTVALKIKQKLGKASVMDSFAGLKRAWLG